MLARNPRPPNRGTAGGRAGRSRTEPREPRVPLRLVVLGPGQMREGRGTRFDTCVRYSECLGAFVAAHPRSDPPAFCPRGCYEPAEMPRADAYRSLNGQARGA